MFAKIAALFYARVLERHFLGSSLNCLTGDARVNRYEYDTISGALDTRVLKRVMS